VAEFACAIARELGWNEQSVASLRIAAVLHDIGKTVVPAEILSKPGRLSEIEMQLIRQHAAAGAEIVGSIGFERNVAEIIHQHHERLDGSGYPDGLRDGEILMGARILAVADVVEAMVSHRPYRPALPIEVALAELKNVAARSTTRKVVRLPPSSSARGGLHHKVASRSHRASGSEVERRLPSQVWCCPIWVPRPDTHRGPVSDHRPGSRAVAAVDVHQGAART